MTVRNTASHPKLTDSHSRWHLNDQKVLLWLSPQGTVFVFRQMENSKMFVLSFQHEGFIIFPWLVLVTRLFRICNLYHCLPELNLLFVWCVIYSSVALIEPFQLSNNFPLLMFTSTPKEKILRPHTFYFLLTLIMFVDSRRHCKTKNSAAEYFWRQLLYSICKLYFCILLFWRK